jgi:hypothetical protein
MHAPLPDSSKLPGVAAGMSSPHSMIHQCVRGKLGSPGRAHTIHTPRLKAPTSHGRISTRHSRGEACKCEARHQQAHRYTRNGRVVPPRPLQRQQSSHCDCEMQAFSSARGARGGSYLNPTVSSANVMTFPSRTHPHRTVPHTGREAGGLSAPMSSLARGTNTWFGPARSTGLRSDMR